MNMPSTLLALYERLYSTYGPQHWWPAESAFEVMVGAVLTQNTNWQNVERAIDTLRAARQLSLPAVCQLNVSDLAVLIRPSGYFNVKAKRLKNLCQWLVSEGGIESLSQQGTAELRQGLLSVNGVGPETADDILLYACNRPVFVIDAYTRRLLVALGLIAGDEKYEVLRSLFEQNLPADEQLFNDYHALIVHHAKQPCMETKDCRHCFIEKPFISRDSS